MKQHFFILVMVMCSFSAVSKDYYWQSNSDIDNVQKEQIEQWLANGVHTTKSLFKRLPQEKLFFGVDIKSTATEPVPWGQVTRDDVNSIYLQIAPNAHLKQLVNDWTLYHEISHIYLPFLEHKSTWLGEGFATYIQNVTMLHAGIHNKSDFVRKIQAGLNRGIKNTKRVKGKIEQVSMSMRRNKAYMRVYWTGAAFFLEVDAKLQKQNKNLVDIISTYADCCLGNTSSYNESGEELMTVLDTISQTNIFTTQHQTYKQLSSFPIISTKTIEQLADFYQIR